MESLRCVWKYGFPESDRGGAGGDAGGDGMISDVKLEESSSGRPYSALSYHGCFLIVLEGKPAVIHCTCGLATETWSTTFTFHETLHIADSSTLCMITVNALSIAATVHPEVDACKRK